MQYLLYFFRCHAADDRVFQLVRVRAENVLIGDVVAFAIAAYRVGKRHVPAPLPACAQRHQDFVLDAPCRVCSQRRSRCGFEAVHRLNQPNHADGNQVVRAVAGNLVLPRNVAHQTQVVRNQPLPRIVVARVQFPNQLGFLRPIQRRRKLRSPGDVSQKKQTLLHQQRKQLQHTHPSAQRLCAAPEKYHPCIDKRPLSRL